ncbi:MAG: pyridoxal-phosphate dependent enzyme [Bdellovibrionia bacterium]
MLTRALLELNPELEKTYSRLIESPTPAYRLHGLGEIFGHSNLYIKREDLTDSTYGGNKVRNLEFLLGDALRKNATRVVTTAPLGSNFVAALAAQSKKSGLSAEIFHFVPHRNRQIAQHAEFSESQNTKLNICEGRLYPSVVRAGVQMSLELLKDPSTYRMPTGGSSPLGVLGHINAIFELREQIERGDIPEPDFIVVGAGTCGTMAGLLAGILLSGMRTQVFGVRCVDRIVCNRYNIENLANRALKLLGSQNKIRARNILLSDQGPIAYGRSREDAAEMQDVMFESEEIVLDTTYTTKVVSTLSRFLHRSEVGNKNVLYWHTFSDAAVRTQRSRSSLPFFLTSAAGS